MSNTRRELSNLLTVAVGVLLAVAVVGVVLLSISNHLRPLLSRFLSESEPTVGPPPEAFERFRREQDDIADGVDRGPIRCSLSPWTVGGDHPPDLALTLVNKLGEPVTLWYATWPHCHVTFVVRDKGEKIAASFHWGTLSSQAVSVDPQSGRLKTPLPALTLKPGQTYTAGIYLTSLAEYGRVEQPGVYHVEVVFVYSDLGGWPAPDQDFVARSEPVEIEVGKSDADKKPSWQLH